MFMRAPKIKNRRDHFFALESINIEVKKGEVVGIVGGNGAGKSTLLKILSRITVPTVGRIELFGRVGALLEVGTGFHPELTGRENIFLNGAILGMRRAEIRSRFHEIVAFAGVERFLDTAVKHYSSGMYVRLAFAVAANLNPEILILDEVLAVGDAEFQRSCLGKMKDVSNSGTTVLFVSHNMSAINAITRSAIWLQKGKVVASGPTSEIVAKYQMGRRNTLENKDTPGSGRHTKIIGVRLCPGGFQSVSDETVLEVIFRTDGSPGLSIEVFLVDPSGNRVAMSSLHQFFETSLPRKAGTYCYRVKFVPLQLAAGQYSVDVSTSVANVEWDHYVSSAVGIDIPFCRPGRSSWNFDFSHGFGIIPLHSEAEPTITEIDL